MNLRLSVYYKLNGLPKIVKKLSLKRLRYKQYIRNAKLRKVNNKSRMTIRALNIWRKQKHIKPSPRRW